MSYSGLFSLPAELRLMIYGHAVTQCLADGYATDLRGITLCCRTVHQEIEKEFLGKVWRLLRTKHEWETTKLSPAPLRLQLGNDTNFCNGITDVTITVPILDSWWRLLTIYDIGDQQDYQRLVDILRPLFRMPWPTMTIKFDNPNRPNYDFDQYYAFWCILIETLDKGVLMFPSIDRLVLNLGNMETRVDRTFYMNLLSITHTFSTSIMGDVLPRARRALVSLRTSGSTREWEIAFELKKELGKQVEGHMWEFKKTGNRWGARRLFRSMDDLASDDDVEGRYFESSDEEEDGEDAEA
jgi:hypothetical protein